MKKFSQFSLCPSRNVQSFEVKIVVKEYYASDIIVSPRNLCHIYSSRRSLSVLNLNLNLLRNEISIIEVILFVQVVYEATLFMYIITVTQLTYTVYSVVIKCLKVARYYNG